MKPSVLHDTIFENIASSNGVFTSHFHDTYTIGLTHNGMFESFVHGRKTSFAYQYATRIINPGEVHYGDSHAWQYTNFYPSVELLSNLYEQMYGESKMVIFEKHIINDRVLYQLLRQFFHSVYDKEEAMSSEIKLMEALAYLITHYDHKTVPHPFTCKAKKSISMVVEYIHENLENEILLDQLSTTAMLSKYHFVRLFKDHMGITPHQYILSERIYKAKSLVLEGASLTHAALQAGFSDQSHFIRNFRKIYGYSPKTLLQKSNFILYS